MDYLLYVDLVFCWFFFNKVNKKKAPWWYCLTKHSHKKHLHWHQSWHHPTSNLFYRFFRFYIRYSIETHVGTWYPKFTHHIEMCYRSTLSIHQLIFEPLWASFTHVLLYNWMQMFSSLMVGWKQKLANRYIHSLIYTDKYLSHGLNIQTEFCFPLDSILRDNKVNQTLQMKLQELQQLGWNTCLLN